MKFERNNYYTAPKNIIVPFVTNYKYYYPPAMKKLYPARSQITLF